MNERLIPGDSSTWITLAWSRSRSLIYGNTYVTDFINGTVWSDRLDMKYGGLLGVTIILILKISILITESSIPLI